MNESELNAKNYENIMRSADETQALLRKFGDLFQDTRHLRKDDTVGTSNDAQLMHGTGGLFTDACRERDVVNAVRAPIAMDLPAFATTVENPLFSALTGFGDNVGDEPEEECEPGPVPGTMTICDMVFPLGRKAMSTNTIDVDKIITQVCRGDTRDMVLLGNFMQEMSNISSPQGLSDVDRNKILNSVIEHQMAAVGRGYQRWFETKKWSGDPGNPEQSNGYKEFVGLDLLIRTGYLDATIPNDPCPEIDSDVKDFGGECLIGGANDIHQYLSMLEYQLWNRSLQLGLSPVSWLIAMTPQMWHELTIVWPLLQSTQASVQMPVNTQINLDGRTNYLETLEMRRSNQITINGRTYQVAADDGIPREEDVGPTLTSSIYFIPLTILGSVPVTYYEYLDYRQVGNELGNPLSGRLRYWTDDGRYLWTADDRLWCFRLHSKIEPRIVLRTPQLAGRIDNVCISPLQLLDNPLDPLNVIPPPP